VAGDALKMIEDAALNDEVKLQTGFEAYDECSSKSISNKFYLINFKCNLNIESDDGCVTASEIYVCSKEKKPDIVDVFFNANKGNATVVIFEFVR